MKRALLNVCGLGQYEAVHQRREGRRRSALARWTNYDETRRSTIRVT